MTKKDDPNADIDQMGIDELKAAMEKCNKFSKEYEKKVRENTKRKNRIEKRTTGLALGTITEEPELPGVGGGDDEKK